MGDPDITVHGSNPRVCVITPVFDGADVIEGCIRSVREQDVADWVHVVVDNASTDGTTDIVERAAEDDPRVRLVRFDDHLEMLGSWNRATRLAPDDVPYVKHLGADDRMAPQCLRRMVAAAEANPSAVMVSARWREGTTVAPTRHVPRPHVMPGREAMRRYLMGGPDTFGTPSACLYRRDALTGLDPLYPEDPWPPGHPDGEPGPATDKMGYADVLERGDFVFLPEVLTYDKHRPDTQSSFAKHMRVQVPGDLDALIIVGHRFLQREVLARRVRRLALRYSRSLTKAAAQGRPLLEPDFALLHHHVLEHLDRGLAAGGFRSARALLAPHRPVYRAAHLRHRRTPDAPPGDSSTAPRPR